MVFPDISAENFKLQKDSFVLIQRRPASFSHNTDPRWVYVCSCQPIWTRQILSSSMTYSTSYAGFEQQFPNCIHRKVSSKIYEQHDTLNNIQAQDYFTVYSEAGDHDYNKEENSIEEATTWNNLPLVRSRGAKSNGLVSVHKGKYFCFCCHRNYCEHTKYFWNLTESALEKGDFPSCVVTLFNSFNSTVNKSGVPRKINCHSRITIPFSPDGIMSNCLKSGFVTGTRRNTEGVFLFEPDQSVCLNCGSTLEDGDPVEKEWKSSTRVLVISNTDYEFADVFYRPCSGCDEIQMFDGRDQCLLNMGSYIVGHDVLRSYMHNFLHGRRPLYTFYSVFVDVHADLGNYIRKDFTYHHLRAAWLSFLDLLELDFASGYKCPDCPLGPDVVICDGTSLSFQKRMWNWKKSDRPKEASSSKGVRFKDRVYIADQNMRRLLHRFAVGGEFYRGKRVNILNNSEKKELFENLEDYPALKTFLLSVDTETSCLPKPFQKFVTSLSSNSAVCGYIHPTESVGILIKALVSGVAIKSDPKLWQDLHREMPILFELLESSSTSEAPAVLRPLLQELWDMALLPFTFPDDTNTSAVETDEELVFFPSLPLQRPRGIYQMDFERPRKSCGKRYKGHPTLLPGVFTVYCPHGICHGFEVMQTNESPNVPFTILKTRFKRAPRVVIYDNACSLHSYCLNRDPQFFMGTIFLVDRLHWENHSGCSSGYCLDLYPSLASLNSQVNEQANAGLQRIKDQLSYMTADNFMKHCAFFLWNKNRKILA